MSESAESTKQRVKQIREELAASRAKLTAATESAFEAVKPSNLARSAAEQAKSFAITEIKTAFGHFRNEDGSIRVDRILMVSGAVAGAILLTISVKKVRRRKMLERYVLLELEG